MSPPTAVIAGGGIAGLATALGLHRAGWRVTVCEQGSELRSGGGGIGLTPNGLRALDAIGAGAGVRARAIEQREGGIRRPGGTWIARTDLGFIKHRFGDPVIAMLRADLIAAIAELLPPGVVCTGVRVTASRPGSRGRLATMTTTQGELRADLVVGADGIRSAVRAALFPAHPGVRYAGYTSWRMVVPSPALEVAAGETWGRAARFAILPLPADRVHCSALAAAPVGQQCDDERAELIRRFGGWHEPIPALLGAMRPGTVLRHDIEELAVPLPAFHVARTVLTGDAAHAMTPNLGSASLAIEDAACLAYSVAAHVGACGDGVPSALAAYSAARRPRTTRLARRSQRIDAFGQMSSPVAVAARDLCFKLGGLLPSSVTGRALDSLIGWSAPQAR